MFVHMYTIRSFPIMNSVLLDRFIVCFSYVCQTKRIFKLKYNTFHVEFFSDWLNGFRSSY